MKKKVLFVLGYKMYPDITGGMEVFNYRLIEALQDRTDISYTCGRDLGFERARHLPLRPIRPEKWLFPLQVFRHLLRHRDIRSVVFSYSEASWVIWWIFTLMTKWLKLQSTIVIHFGNPHTGSSRSVLSAFFHSAQTVIAVSKDIKRNYDAAFGLHCLVVPPAIPFTHSPKNKEQLRCEWGLPQNAFVISMVGSLKEMKNPDTAIECLSSFSQEEHAAVHPFLLYAGDGPMLPALQAMADSTGLSRQVSFLGRIPQDRVSEVMTCTDCFLIASDFEGTSLSLMEAMSNSLPILASNVPGLKDMVTDGQNGLLFERRNAVSLKQGILRYFKNPGLRTKTGTNARTDFSQYYSFETVLNRYLEVL